MCGVESLDEVGLDPSARGNDEAVLGGLVPDRFQLLGGSTRPRHLDRRRSISTGFAGRGEILRDLDIWSEYRFDLVSIRGSQINPIIGTLIREGNFVSQSGVDGFSIEIVDKLANKYFGHRESSSLRCWMNIAFMLSAVSDNSGHSYSGLADHQPHG